MLKAQDSYHSIPEITKANQATTQNMFLKTLCLKYGKVKYASKYPSKT